jgi:hypothetical protein
MMSWLKRAASPATLIAMLALVAAVVGTAIAGPRQSNTAKTAKRALKLAKKNQRRINKIQLTPGPQGLQGEPGLQGLRGLQGPPGPTFAAAPNGMEPPANPEEILFPLAADVNTPAPGRLLVMYSGATFLEINCTAGAPRIGMYVDGEPVPWTGRSFEASGEQPPATAAAGIFGVTANVLPAGKHTAAVFAECPSGEFTGGTAGENSFGAILLGQ